MQYSWILASQNAHKHKEFALALKPFGLQMVIAPRGIEVQENASTFQGNALLKALAYTQAFGSSALADDSGLCVDALDGAPGVHSARFSGEEHGPDRDLANNTKLLESLHGVEGTKRSARFVCSLVAIVVERDFVERCTKLVHPHVRIDELGRAVLSVEGYAHGEILHEAQGSNGFGYDPLFYCTKLHKSFAQLTAQEKLAVSHRGAAIAQLCALLGQVLAS